MLRKIVRLFLRLAGWLLTPIASIVAAILGALLGALVAPVMSPNAGLMITIGTALVGAAIGLWLWLRLVRRTPELQAALAVSAEGVPTEEALEEFTAPLPSEEKSVP